MRLGKSEPHFFGSLSTVGGKTKSADDFRAYLETCYSSLFLGLEEAECFVSAYSHLPESEG